MKKSCKLTTVLIIVSLILVLTGCSHGKSKEETKTDIQPLINRFPEFISDDNTVNCFWTYSLYNSDARIGPSTYHMEGFIDITDTELEHLLEKYEFTESELAVDELLQPYLLEYENVKWCYSKELSYDITKSNFVGHFYLDVNNGLYYFELDSN